MKFIFVNAIKSNVNFAKIDETLSRQHFNKFYNILICLMKTMIYFNSVESILQYSLFEKKKNKNKNEA